MLTSSYAKLGLRLWLLSWERRKEVSENLLWLQDYSALLQVCVVLPEFSSAPAALVRYDLYIVNENALEHR